MKENGFKLAKERSRRYSAQIISDTDYADDIAFLANSLIQAESLLYSLERAAGGIGLYVKFPYLGSSVSSTGNDFNTRLAKAWTATGRLSVIWKSDLTNKIKRIFSKQRSYQYCYVDAPHGS